MLRRSRLPRFRVIVGPLAEQDLAQVAEYVSRDSPSRAETLLNRLGDAIASLSIGPLRWPVAPESEAFAREIRQRTVRPFRVVFEIRGDVVFVLRVRHGARRTLDPALDRLDA